MITLNPGFHRTEINNSAGPIARRAWERLDQKTKSEYGEHYVEAVVEVRGREGGRARSAISSAAHMGQTLVSVAHNSVACPDGCAGWLGPKSMEGFTIQNALDPIHVVNVSALLAPPTTPSLCPALSLPLLVP